MSAERTNLLMKSVSLTVAVTFLFWQVAWAIGIPYGAPRDNEKNHSGFMSAERLAQAQKRQEELVARLDRSLKDKTAWSAEDREAWELKRKTGASGESGRADGAASAPEPAGPEGPEAAVLRVTTKAGDIIQYNEGSIERVEQRDGTVIEDIELSEAGDITGGIIRYSDGAVLVVEAGRARSYLGPDGTALHYDDDGRLESQVTSDGLVSYYTYAFDAVNTLIHTIVTSAEDIVEYDGGGRLVRVTKWEGTVIEYESGIVSAITKPDGSRYLFEKSLRDALAEVRARSYLDEDGYTYLFDDTSHVVSVTSPSGAVTVYSEDGRPVSTVNGPFTMGYDEKGRVNTLTGKAKAFRFTYEEDADGLIERTLITDEDGVAGSYDADGDLLNVRDGAAASDPATLEKLRADLASIEEALRAAREERTDREGILANARKVLEAAVAQKDIALKAYSDAESRYSASTKAHLDAEALLPQESSGVVTKYSYAPAKMTLAQYKILLNEKFDSYAAALWNKPLDSYVQFASGEALLKGTGKDTVANFYSKQTYLRSDNPTVAFDFKVDSVNGSFTGGLENALAGSGYRRLALVASGGKVRVQTYDGTKYQYFDTAVTALKANVYYSVAFEVTAASTKVFVWEKGTAKPAQPSYTFTKADWDVRPRFWLQTGKAWVDNVKVQSGLALTKEYDSQGRILKQDLRDGLVTAYAYAGTAAVRTDADDFDKVSPLWTMPATSLYALSGGKLLLKGNNTNSAASFSQKLYQPRSSNPSYTVDFSVNNTNANLSVGLEGALAGKSKRIALVSSAGKVYVQTTSNGTTSTAATPVAAVKINTQYTASFEATPAGIKVFIWEKFAVKPATPAYVWNDTGWDTRYSSSIKTGAATFDTFSLSQNVPPPAADAVIAGLKAKIEAEAAAKTARDAALKAFDAANALEASARSALADADKTLASAAAIEADLLSRKNAAQGVYYSAKALFELFAARIAAYDYTDGTVTRDAGGVEAAFISDVGFRKAIYGANGIVKEIDGFDGSKVTHDENGLPLSMTGAAGAAGAAASCSYLWGSRGDVMGITVEEDGLERLYGLKGELASVTAQGTATVEYKDNAVSAITTPDGMKRLYKAGVLDGLIDKDGASYTFDADQRPVSAKDRYGNLYEYLYSVDPEDSKEIVEVEESSTGLVRFYKEDLLFHTEDPSALTSDNTYDAKKRLAEVIVQKYDRTIARYSYFYNDDGTTAVADIDGNLRTYGQDEKPVSLLDTEKNLYRYVYPDSASVVMEMVESRRGDDTIFYQNGQVDAIATADGRRYSQISLDGAKAVAGFRQELPDGSVEDVRLFGDVYDVTAIDAASGSRGGSFLVSGGVVVSMATSQGAVSFIEEDAYEALAGRLPSAVAAQYRPAKRGGNPGAAVTITGQPWTPQGYFSMRAIESIAKNVSDDTLILNTNLIAGDDAKSQGEIVLDLRYYQPPHYPTKGPVDLTGRDISFLVKIPEGSLPRDPKPLQIQAFAKDESWRSCYGSAVSISEDGTWYRIHVRPTHDAVATGIVSSSFDPTRVVLIGLRVYTTSDSYITYNGPILVKDGTAMEGLAYAESPVLVRLQDVVSYVEGERHAPVFLTEKNFLSGGEVESLFDPGYGDALGLGDNRTIDFGAAGWRAQRYYDSKAFSAIVRDDASDTWTVSAKFDKSERGYLNGEAVLDLRYDIPGLVWRGPVDLQGKSLTFRIKVPREFIGDAKDYQNYAQVFVKSEGYESQYGASVTLTGADEWYTVTLTPKAGWLENGYTSGGFDPSKVIQVGIKVHGAKAAQAGFSGTILIRHEVAPDTFEGSSFGGIYVDAKGYADYVKSSRAPQKVKDDVPPRIAYAKAFSRYVLADDFVVSKEYFHNNLKRVHKKDGTSVTYTSRGNIDYVSNEEEGLLVDYEYDDNGDLTDLIMHGARRDLAASVDDARDKVEEEKSKALEELARQRGIVVSEIYQRVAPDLNSLVSQRDNLRGQYNDLNGRRVPFWEKKNKSNALHSIAVAIDQVNAAIAQVYSQLNQAYAQVDAEVAKLAADIEGQAALALADVKAQEDKLLLDIVKQETQPVILHYYRTVLGRDPDAAETAQWLSQLSTDQQKIDKNELIRSILASSEYNSRKTEVARIKADVRSRLTAYLALTSDQERDSFLTPLGLTRQDLTEISKYDAEKVLQWIDSQGLHFGQSAFLALKKILEANSISVDIEELAANVILIDILTGAIDIFTRGDLELSMYGLSKYAESKRLTLYNTKLTWDDLEGLLPLPSGERDGVRGVIAHVDGNHYVVITKIVDGKVYYREENRGPSGTEEVISKDEFLKKWSGYAIVQGESLESPLPSGEREGVRGKVITAAEAKTIKGAFFFMFIGIIIGAIINAIAGVITGIIAAIGFIINGVVAAVAAALANITTFIATVGTQLATGISAAFGNLGGIMAGTLGATSFIGAALKSIVGVGLSLGITTGLQALGVNSTISNLTGAFLTGGIVGLINLPANVSVFSVFMGEGLKYATVTGINELGPRLGLDPMITSILSMTSGQLVGGLWQGKIGETLIQIAPTLSKDIAFYGISKIGEVLGVDPRINQILSSAGSAMTSTYMNAIQSPHSTMIDSISRSINSGIVSVGVNLLSLVNPAIPAALQASGLVNAVENILNKEGLFNGVFTIFQRAVPTAFAAVTSSIVNLFEGAKTFGRLVMENNLLGAVNTALESLFAQHTIESVNRQGGIEDILARPRDTVILPDGRIAQEIELSDSASIFLDEEGELLSVKEDGLTYTGSFELTNHYGLALREGTIAGDLENGLALQSTIADGAVRYVVINDEDGNQRLQIDPEEPSGAINLQSAFDPIISGFTFVLVNAILTFANDFMAKVHDEKVESIDQKVTAISAGSLLNGTNKFLYALANGIRNPEINQNNPPQYILNLKKDLKDHSDNAITDGDILPLPLYHGMTSWSGANGLIDMIKWLVESQTIYKNSLVRKVQTDLTSYFATHPAEWNRPVVGMGYSGGLMPFIEAVSSSLYNVKTIVGLGAPTAYLSAEWLSVLQHIVSSVVNKAIDGVEERLKKMSFAGSFISRFLGIVQGYYNEDILPMLKEVLQKAITLTNLGVDSFNYSPPRTDLIVNVWGTEDDFYKELGVVGKRENFLGKNTVNIEIVGATHFDYMRRDINDRENPPNTWNNTVASFVTDLMLASKDNNSLQDFINIKINQGEISPLDGRGVYVVHLPGSGI